MKDPETVARIVHLTAADTSVHHALLALERAIRDVAFAVPADHPIVKPIHTAHVELLKASALIASTVRRLRR